LRGLADLQEMIHAFGKARDSGGILDILLDRALSAGYVAAGRGSTRIETNSDRRDKLPVDAGVLEIVVQAGEILEVTGPHQISTLFGDEDAQETKFTVVPLITQSDPVGALIIRTPIPNDEVCHSLGILAYMAGDTIEREKFCDVHLYRSLLETIGQLGNKVSSISELDELLPYTVESVCRNFAYTRVSLYLRSNGNIVAYQANHEEQGFTVSMVDTVEPFTDTPAAHVIATGMPAEIEHKETEGTFSVTHLRPESRSEFAVPIMLGHEVIGALAVESGQVSGVNAEERSTIQALCGLIALAVESARMLGQSDRRLSELAALINLGHAIGSVLDQKKVSQLILDGATGLTDADYAGLFLKEGDELVLSATLNRGGRDSDIDDATAFNVEQAIAVSESGQPLLLPASSKSGYSILSVPLRVKHKVIGVIQLVRQSEASSFDSDDERLAEALALPSSVALENAQLYEETERRLAEVSTLYTLAQRMSSSLDLNQMLDSLVVILRRVIDCRGCCIFLLDERSGLLEVRAASGLKQKWQSEAKLRVGEGVSGLVVQNEKPIYIADTHKEPDFIFFDTKVRSLLAVPMMTKGHVIGTLSVDDDTPDAFDEDEGRLLTIAAAQAATTIENARLYESLKERARRLKLAFDELKELNRLKSEFVQNVSHELRTPLTFIRGYVELLRDGSLGDISSTQLEALQVVSAKTEALTHLVSDIISLQKAEMTALDLAPVSLADVIDLTLRGAEAAIHEAGLTLTQEVPFDLEPVLADRSRLGQVLDNLIGNALKFTPAGGEIEIQVQDLDEFERVSVTDTGIGIPASKQKKVFEPFYQIDGSSTRRFGGAGLGLAIVRQIVEAHGGTVGVISEPGKGSTFYFTVPKYQPGTPILSPSDLDLL